MCELVLREPSVFFSVSILLLLNPTNVMPIPKIRRVRRIAVSNSAFRREVSESLVTRLAILSIFAVLSCYDSAILLRCERRTN